MFGNQEIEKSFGRQLGEDVIRTTIVTVLPLVIMGALGWVWTKFEERQMVKDTHSDK